MADFNIIVPEIGGVDTSDPSRPFSAQEQKPVISAVFGTANRTEPPLIIPGSGHRLYVGQRLTSSSYSIGRKPSGLGDEVEFPALFTPKTGDMVMAVVREDGGFDGFIPESVRRLLSLGKHMMREHAEGRKIDFKASPTSGHKAVREHLAKICLWDGLLDEGDGDYDQQDWDDFNEAIQNFLGRELGEIERDNIVNRDGGDFEKFIIDIIGRLRAIRT